MRRAKLFMDTVVDIQVLAACSQEETRAAMDRSFEAFRLVEQTCSRFSSESEVMTLCRQVGIPVPVSPLLFEPLRFALELAAHTDGVFDPTIGGTMQSTGFDRHYLTGDVIHSLSAEGVSFRDIQLDEGNRTVTLHQPMVIDLGAVAKGFAIDLAVHELRRLEPTGFLINAGGDLYAGGGDVDGGRWKVGIQHPDRPDGVIDQIELSESAVCTSGSYERRSPLQADTHHIIDPATGRSPRGWVSCSVIAPYAMMADGFSTACFLLGRDPGIALLEEAGLQGLLITPELEISRVGMELP